MEGNIALTVKLEIFILVPHIDNFPNQNLKIRMMQLTGQSFYYNGRHRSAVFEAPKHIAVCWYLFLW